MSETNDFSQHHQAAAAQALPPAKSLLALLPYLTKAPSSTAIDLGCGAGIDTLYLLNTGWQVIAIDQNAQAVEKLKETWPGSQLTISVQSFENLKLPEAQLINASFALPFCRPEHFSDCWDHILNALSKGSGFSGHFFGLKDSWAGRNDMTFVTDAMLQRFFESFDIKWLEETERDGKTLGGAVKHWHVYHVAAVKR